MKTRHIYIALCALGVLLPNAAIAPWLLEHGLSPGLFVRDLFANGVRGFFALDVIISAVAVCAFAAVEGRRLRLRRWWLAIAAVALVGVSLGLPLPFSTSGRCTWMRPPPCKGIRWALTPASGGSWLVVPSDRVARLAADRPRSIFGIDAGVGSTRE